MVDLIGRDLELEAIDRFLGLAAEARSALAILGEAGIGKTALWQHAVESAAARGWRVLRTEPSEPEVHDAYAGLTDLLGPSFDAVASALPQPLATALAKALLRSSATERGEVRAIGAATAAALSQLAETQPVLVAIDDVQWLDADSVRALTVALVRASPAVSVAVASRSDDPSILPLGIARAVEPERCVRVVPLPLSLAGVHLLVHRFIGEDLPRGIVTRISAATGGNPFATLELARAWRDRRHISDELTVPGSVTALVERRLGQLSPAARDLVLYVATAGRPTLEVLDSLIGAGAAALLEEVEAAGVLREDGGRIVATHPLLATTTYGTATQARRRHVHARLAEVATDPEERARHLAAAVSRPNEAVARLILTGARTALSRGAPVAAAELFAAAGRLMPSDSGKLASIMADEAIARLAAGEVTAARGLAERALTTAPTTTARLEILVQIVDIAWADGAIERERKRILAALAHATGPASSSISGRAWSRSGSLLRRRRRSRRRTRCSSRSTPR
jgi:predicted ATPase